MDNITPEYKESTTITFEWTLRGLKSLFETRLVCWSGIIPDACWAYTAKATRSRKWQNRSDLEEDGGRQVAINITVLRSPESGHQILFYANSGTSANLEGQGFVSLYLSCEVGILVFYALQNIYCSIY